MSVKNVFTCKSLLKFVKRALNHIFHRENVKYLVTVHLLAMVSTVFKSFTVVLKLYSDLEPSNDQRKTIKFQELTNPSEKSFIKSSKRYLQRIHKIVVKYKKKYLFITNWQNMSAQHPRDLLIIQEIKIITPHTNRACIYFFHIITTATDVTTFVNFYLETEQIVANFSISFSVFFLWNRWTWWNFNHDWGIKLWTRTLFGIEKPWSFLLPSFLCFISRHSEN